MSFGQAEHSLSPVKAPELSDILESTLQYTPGSIKEIFNVFFDSQSCFKGQLSEKIVEHSLEQGFVGFRFLAQGWIQGHYQLAISFEGEFILSLSQAKNGFFRTRFDYFGQDGNYLRSTSEAPAKLLIPPTLKTFSSRPLLNGLLNLNSALYLQYDLLQKSPLTLLNFQKSLFHAVKSTQAELPKIILQEIQELFKTQLYAVEANPLLKWEDRQVIFTQKLTELSDLHLDLQKIFKLSSMSLFLQRLKIKNQLRLMRWKTNPLNNARNLIWEWTGKKVIWFFQTVKNNLGYSIALAVYGPFTYYFITMPMNPHAMQAVGKVRSSYVEYKDRLIAYLAELEEVTVVEGSAPEDASLNNLTQGKFFWDPTQIHKPQLGDFLVSFDIPSVTNLSWKERMGHFKQMQIAFEEDLEFAPRMGRLEQLETQYNFSLMSESTWQEMERYSQEIFELRKNYPELPLPLQNYLNQEVALIHQYELYLWDRLLRFVLDQPYVMMDIEGEQSGQDYYLGRSFIFLDEMTQVMKWRYPQIVLPETYAPIEKLAKNFRAKKIYKSTLEESLKVNSSLLKQQEQLATQKKAQPYREMMKRQWEILYLQNSKAEEASNNGLNLYIWSVRNTVWSLQTLMSAKRKELSILEKSFLLNALPANQTVTNEQRLKTAQFEISQTEHLIENIYHNLLLEWAGLKREIQEHLPKDLEAHQREYLLQSLKKNFQERERMLRFFKVKA
jgi:hypothetical protein